MGVDLLEESLWTNGQLRLRPCVVTKTSGSIPTDLKTCGSAWFLQNLILATMSSSDFPVPPDSEAASAR
jgi:hypothetical protein